MAASQFSRSPQTLLFVSSNTNSEYAEEHGGIESRVSHFSDHFADPRLGVWHDIDQRSIVRVAVGAVVRVVGPLRKQHIIESVTFVLHGCLGVREQKY